MNTSLNTSTENLFAELDYRENDEIEVSLLWNRSNNTLNLLVCDTRTGESLEFPVQPSEARDAFEHPYAYAGACGAETCRLAVA